jgi:hypothetical protein
MTIIAQNSAPMRYHIAGFYSYFYDQRNLNPDIESVSGGGCLNQNLL